MMSKLAVVLCGLGIAAALHGLALWADPGAMALILGEPLADTICRGE
jgi:hypothetical protein